MHIYLVKVQFGLLCKHQNVPRGGVSTHTHTQFPVAYRPIRQPGPQPGPGFQRWKWEGLAGEAGTVPTSEAEEELEEEGRPAIMLLVRRKEE